MFKFTRKLLYIAAVLLLALDIYLLTAMPDVIIPEQDNNAIIRLVNPESGRTYCSGTVVNDKFIITAAHCVLAPNPFGFVMLNPEHIEIRQADNTPIGTYGVAITANVSMDQAVLYGNFQKLPKRKYISNFKTLDDIRLNPGQELKACGYPLGGNFECSNIKVEDMYIFMWQTTGGWLIPGMSGGPVMLKDGTVVAVNVAATIDRRLVSPTLNIENMMKIPRRPAYVAPSPEEEEAANETPEGPAEPNESKQRYYVGISQ